MRKPTVLVGVALVLAGSGLTARHGTVLLPGSGGHTAAASSAQAVTSADLDSLLAPIALYPDQLLAQMLLCATDPAGVTALDQFLTSHSTLKGTDLQDAALKDNFQPSFVALVLFPQVVQQMAETAGLDDPPR